MQIGRVRFARVKCHDYPFPLSIDAHIAYTWNSHEWGAQLSHAFITTLAFGRDRDPLQNRLVRTLQAVRIGRIEVMRIKGFDHRLSLFSTVAPLRASGSIPYLNCLAPYLRAHHLLSRAA